MLENKKVFAMPKLQFDDMMKKFNITLDNIELKKDACFISINETMQDHEDVKPYFTEDRSNLKVMYFDDIEADLPYVHKGKDIIIKAFSEEQAKELYDFIKTNQEKRVFYVHCAAGVSRSGGVATFISDYLRCDYNEFKKNNPHIHPNGLVVSLLNRIARGDD